MSPALLLLVGLGLALDARQGLELDYRRGPGADSCPGEGDLKTAVAERLGYWPWRARADWTVLVEVAQEQERLRAHVALVDAHGQEHGTRVLESTSRDCVELMASTALAISIAVDPLVLMRPPVPVTPPRPPTRTPVPTVRRTTPPAPIPRRHEPAFHYAGYGRLVLGLMSAPRPAPGVLVGTALGWRGWSLGLEARWDAPVPTADGAVGVGYLRASLVPCFAAGWLQACGTTTLGATYVTVSQAWTARAFSAPYASVGARAGLRVPVHPRLSLGAWWEAEGLLTRLDVRDTSTQRSIWMSPPVSLSLHAGPELRFP
ncbi:MAG: hypothetical protein AB2A00_17175 [Myxococcota bacterium]